MYVEVETPTMKTNEHVQKDQEYIHNRATEADPMMTAGEGLLYRSREQGGGQKSRFYQYGARA